MKPLIGRKSGKKFVEIVFTIDLDFVYLPSLDLAWVRRK